VSRHLIHEIQPRPLVVAAQQAFAMLVNGANPAQGGKEVRPNPTTLQDSNLQRGQHRKKLAESCKICQIGRSMSEKVACLTTSVVILMRSTMGNVLVRRHCHVRQHAPHIRMDRLCWITCSGQEAISFVADRLSTDDSGTSTAPPIHSWWQGVSAHLVIAELILVQELLHQGPPVFQCNQLPSGFV
jgi:hypothetical protein